MKNVCYIGLLIIVLCYSCNKNSTSVPTIENQEKIVIETPISIDSTIIKNYHPRTFDFYKDNNFNTVWYQKKNREIYLNFLESVDEEGLNPKDYWYTSIKEKINIYDTLNTKELANLDALLTKSFLKLANNIYSGKLNPKTLYNDWEMFPKTIQNPERLLTKALNTQKIATVLDSLRPTNKLYNKLREELKEYKNLDNDSSSIAQLQINIKKPLVLNDTNKIVYEIKKKLDYLDYYKINDTLSNTVYTEDLEVAVKNFQKTHNLKPSGIIGLNTIRAINKNKEYRKSQIIANLERLRWFPKDLGKDYVIVNIPEFKLWLISNNDTLMSKLVIVGRAERKTPILSSKFSDIVLNPTWTVPPTILKKDLTPAAQKDSNYFHRNRIKIYQGTELVSPSNWNASEASRYRYVQDPGKNNSLGVIKFNFPNNYSVYLHDTNHKTGFGKEIRDISSGCIRVNQPLELASMIFKIDSNNVMNSKKIDDIIKNGKTTNIRIKNPIYVHQFYWTVSVDNDGEIIYNEDIYDLDIPLFNAMKT